jgi:lambda repressor-like predicted transcriptional regulator
MVISEEKKSKIIELREKGLNKKEISRATQVSFPTIKNILDENEIKQNQEIINERNGVLVKKLSEIFNYENCTEESVLDLIFNLKRIANDSGRELGEFVEDIEFIFDRINKYTENPIKLFNFIVNISSNLSLLFNSIEPEPFLEIVQDYYESGLSLKEAKEGMSEIEEKAESLLEKVKEEYNYWQERGDNAQEEYQSIASLQMVFLNKMIEAPNKEKLGETEEKLKIAENRIRDLEMSKQILIEKGKSLEISDKESKIIRQDNIMFNMVYERLYEQFPNEINSILKEIDNENS